MPRVIFSYNIGLLPTSLRVASMSNVSYPHVNIIHICTTKIAATIFEKCTCKTACAYVCVVGVGEGGGKGGKKSDRDKKNRKESKLRGRRNEDKGKPTQNDDKIKQAVDRRCIKVYHLLSRKTI